MKHAYLIQAHNNKNQLLKLIHSLDYELNDIYIHIDAKSDLIQFVNVLTSTIDFYYCVPELNRHVSYLFIPLKHIINNIFQSFAEFFIIACIFFCLIIIFKILNNTAKHIYILNINDISKSFFYLF